MTLMETGQAIPDFLEHYKPEDANISKLKFEYDTDEEDPGENGAGGDVGVSNGNQGGGGDAGGWGVAANGGSGGGGWSPAQESSNAAAW